MNMLILMQKSPNSAPSRALCTGRRVALESPTPFLPAPLFFFAAFFLHLAVEAIGAVALRHGSVFVVQAIFRAAALGVVFTVVPMPALAFVVATIISGRMWCSISILQEKQIVNHKKKKSQKEKIVR